MRRTAVVIVLLMAGCGAGPEGDVPGPGALGDGAACREDEECNSKACLALEVGRICGRPCDRSSDCAGGEVCGVRAAARASPDGVVLACVAAGAGGRASGQRCSADADCRSTFCHDGVCLDLQRSACEEAGTVNETLEVTRFSGRDVRAPVCRFRLAKPSIELGPTSATADRPAEIALDVPGGLASFSVVMVDEDGLRIAVRSVVAPDGTELLDLDDGDPDISPASPYLGATTLMVPLTDDPRARPASGRWSIRVGLHEKNLAELIPTAGDLERVYAVFEPERELGGKLDLVLHLAPGTRLSTATATTNPFLGEMVSRIGRELAERAELEIGEVRYRALDAEHDRVEDGDEARALCRTRAEPGPFGASVNLFLVQDVAWASGHTGGIPGPPDAYGTFASGIVIERIGSARDTGILAAHEIGHFLGLRHTSELEGGGRDPISDTPECPRGTRVEDCPDFKNLLFPRFPLADDLELTPGQVRVLRANPLLTELPAP